MHAGIDIEMRGEGAFVMFCSDRPKEVQVDGVVLDGDTSDGWWCSEDGVLSIDVATSALNGDVRHVLQVIFEHM